MSKYRKIIALSRYIDIKFQKILTPIWHRGAQPDGVSEKPMLFPRKLSFKFYFKFTILLYRLY